MRIPLDSVELTIGVKVKIGTLVERRVRTEAVVSNQEVEVESGIVREGVPQEKDSLPTFGVAVIKVVLVVVVSLEGVMRVSMLLPRGDIQRTDP